MLEALRALDGTNVARPVTSRGSGTGIQRRIGALWINMVGGAELLPSLEELESDWEVVGWDVVQDERRARGGTAARATVRP